jgi:hypothetical protein
VPAREEPADQRDHRRDLASGVRHDIGRAPSESRHVRSKPPLLPSAQRAPGLSIARRSLQDRFVDVGDVLDVAYSPAGGLQVPDEHVEQKKRPGMAKMGRIVGGDAAHVQGHRPPVSPEGDPTPSARVVEGQHDDRSPGTRRPHPPVALSRCTWFSLRPPRDASSIPHRTGGVAPSTCALSGGNRCSVRPALPRRAAARFRPRRGVAFCCWAKALGLSAGARAGRIR